MRCAKCDQWIMPGYEVAYQKKVFHDICATKQIEEDKQKDIAETESAERAIKARKQFRVFIGGKK